MSFIHYAIFTKLFARLQLGRRRCRVRALEEVLQQRSVGIGQSAVTRRLDEQRTKLGALLTNEGEVALDGGGPLPFPAYLHPRNPFEQLANLSNSLAHLKRKGLRLLNIGPEVYNPADPVSGFAAIPRNSEPPSRSACRCTPPELPAALQ